MSDARFMANFLLLHAKSDGTVQLTQQEIASHLGTTREVIARGLGHLAAERQIRTGRRRIVINDPNALAGFAAKRGRRGSGVSRQDRDRNGASRRSASVEKGA